MLSQPTSKKLSPIIGQNISSSEENSLNNENKNNKGSQNSGKSEGLTVTKTVVINNSNSSSSSGAGQLQVVDNYIEPIFKIEKVPSNKASSNENSNGKENAATSQKSDWKPFATLNVDFSFCLYAWLQFVFEKYGIK